jgi:hypothetical protein
VTCAPAGADLPERVQASGGLAEPMEESLLQEEVAWIYQNAFEGTYVSQW